ncbi:hypothetical protein ACFSKW_45975 [Nonomuraea mangrovi]|uniref:Uncharacterized protein n=1 Tax=Nonomuraea mangrovi TaxID=2316207 RepID=A0ABW4TBW5_9ACTN
MPRGLLVWAVFFLGGAAGMAVHLAQAAHDPLGLMGVFASLGLSLVLYGALTGRRRLLRQRAQADPAPLDAPATYGHGGS